MSQMQLKPVSILVLPTSILTTLNERLVIASKTNESFIVGNSDQQSASCPAIQKACNSFDTNRLCNALRLSGFAQVGGLIWSCLPVIPSQGLLKLNRRRFTELKCLPKELIGSKFIPNIPNTKQSARECQHEGCREIY